MTYIDPFAKIGDRKEKYTEHTTNPDWINLNMLKWEFKLPKIEFSISFNLTFNFVLDFYLNFDLGIDYSEFDFEMPNFTLYLKKVVKAYYNKTRYDESYYDPPEIVGKDLARFLWNIRYLTTEKNVGCYKKVGNALKNQVYSLVDILINKGVKREYAEAMIETLLKVEGKILNNSYVGFSIVGLSKVMKPTKGSDITVAETEFRWTDDFKTPKKIKTLTTYDSVVGYVRVGYTRVTPGHRGNIVGFKREVLKPLSEDLAKRVDEFKKRSAKTPITKGLTRSKEVEVRPEIREITQHIPPPKHTLYQRVFFLQKREKMKWEGGKHQARLQNIIEHVKPVLDKHGVHGNFRLGYITFAKEYVYLHYKPHRKYKQWKRNLTEDDLVRKYKRMGCDEQILREIISIVNTFKTVVDLEGKS